MQLIGSAKVCTHLRERLIDSGSGKYIRFMTNSVPNWKKIFCGFLSVRGKIVLALTHCYKPNKFFYIDVIELPEQRKMLRLKKSYFKLPSHAIHMIRFHSCIVSHLPHWCFLWQTNEVAVHCWWLFSSLLHLDACDRHLLVDQQNHHQLMHQTWHTYAVILWDSKLTSRGSIFVLLNITHIAVYFYFQLLINSICILVTIPFQYILFSAKVKLRLSHTQKCWYYFVCQLLHIWHAV